MDEESQSKRAQKQSNSFNKRESLKELKLSHTIAEERRELTAKACGLFLTRGNWS